MPRSVRSATVLALAVLASGSLVSSCGARSVADEGTAVKPATSRSYACLPPQPQATPREVRAGGTVVLSGAAFPCDDRYPAGTTYRIQLMSADDDEQTFDLGEVPVGADGTFEARLTVPAETHPGTKVLGVHGSPWDDCPDNASCAAFGAVLRVLARP